MNKKFTVRIASLFVALSLVGTLFTGCQSSKKEQDKGTETNKETTTQGATTTYPLKTDVTLKYWMSLNSNANVTNMGDTPFFQELQKRTGVKMTFIHPPANQATESLNMMLASGELPDLIENDWYNFPGGPEKAIKDGYILKLNDVIEKNSPNLKGYLKSKPDVDKLVKTDNGSYYVYPFLRGDEVLTVFYGGMMRKDWLDELSLKAPTTIDEWYTVLKAFKEKKGSEAPLSFVMVPNNDTPFINGDAIIGAYGISKTFYVDNGKVKFGPAQPEFKDFLNTMRKWYQEGLIDKNVATSDTKAVDANITNGKSGATFGYNGGTLGKYLTAMKEKDPKFDLVAVPYPTLKAGEKAKLGQKDFAYSPNGSVAITTKCKNVDIAAKLLDYGYGAEGSTLYNFGIEGTSYKMENGKATYTDLVMKNPEKLSIAQAMSKYIRASSYGPFVQDKGYIEQYLQMPQQKNAVNVWGNTDAVKYKLPRVTPTPEESTQLAKIKNEVDTAVDEYMIKVILGADSVDNFDKYADKLKKMNIDKALEIYQTALDRFNKR